MNGIACRHASPNVAPSRSRAIGSPRVIPEWHHVGAPETGARTGEPVSGPRAGEAISTGTRRL